VGNNAVGGVGNNRGSVDGMGNNGSVDSVGNDGSSMNSVSNHGGSSDVSTSRGRGVLGLTSILNSSNVAGQVIGVVGDGLDSAVGKVDGVRSSHGTGAIVGLGLVESSTGVVIGNSVLVSVGGRFREVRGSIAGNGVDQGSGMVLGGSGGNGHKGKGGEGLHDD